MVYAGHSVYADTLEQPGALFIFHKRRTVVDMWAQTETTPRARAARPVVIALSVSILFRPLLKKMDTMEEGKWSDVQ